MAVLLFHFGTQKYFPGGQLGVDIFFVLSGFLITGLLLSEWEELGSISLRKFYARRALRLLPAVLIFLICFTFISLALKSYTIRRRATPWESPRLRHCGRHVYVQLGGSCQQFDISLGL